MNKLVKVSLIIIISLIGLFSAYKILRSTDLNEYISILEGQRVEKDIWYSSNFDSPFQKTNTPFYRLDYFPVNEEYIVTASFKKSTSSDSVHLITSTGEKQSLLIFGKASFTWKGKAQSLLLLYNGEKELFVPFIDSTSGKTTYGAGRYLETKIPTSNEVVIDFNEAYNPYCAYVDIYSCPFPPKENVLNIAIEAGEKNYKH